MRLKLLIVIVLPLLIGCERKHHKDHLSLPGVTVTPPVDPLTILVAGQSNALRLNPAGYAGWNATRNSNDTFINCAENGTTLAQWDPGGPRFANCLSMAQGKKIDVILWYQGESDAAAGGAPATYDMKLTQLFGMFHTKFGSKIQIVFAQIAVISPALAPGFPDWQEIKNKQASIYYPQVTMINTDTIGPGNPLMGDGIHFEDNGYYEVGARFAKAYMGTGH